MNFCGAEEFSWLPPKNKVADEKTDHYDMTRKFVCLISHFVLRRQPVEFFFSKNILSNKSMSKKNKYDIKKTLDLMQVLHSFFPGETF